MKDADFKVLFAGILLSLALILGLGILTWSMSIRVDSFIASCGAMTNGGLSISP